LEQRIAFSHMIVYPPFEGKELHTQIIQLMYSGAVKQNDIGTAMHTDYEAAPGGRASTIRRASDTRLHGRLLLLGRIAWVVVAALSVSLFLLGLLPYSAQLRAVCIPTTDACSLMHALSPVGVQALHNLGLPVDGYVWYTVVMMGSVELVWASVGLLVFWHRSDDWMALLVALSLVTLNPAFTAGPTSSLMQISPLWSLPVKCLHFLGTVLIGLFFYLFPNGRFVPRWIGWILVPYLMVSIALTLPPRNSALNANNWPVWLFDSLLLIFVGTFVCLQVYRYRRVSTPTERQQTRWVLFGVVIALIGMLALSLVPDSFHLQFGLFDVAFGTLYFGVLLAIPLCIGAAMLRSHLYDVDVLFNRTLVYGLLTVSTLALYVLVVFGASALFRVQNDLIFSLLATVLIAVLFQPLRQWLQHGVNRLMFGERNEPYRVLSRLGQRLEETLPAESFLPMIVETVAHALKLPYVAILWKRKQGFVGTEPQLPAAAFGTSSGSDADTRVPLVHQGEQVGELVLSPRQRGEHLTPADLRLVRDLVPQIAIAVYSARLTVDLQGLTIDLQRSREHLVTAREEERRRLRRDLHDGLGPQLSSQTLTLSAIKKLLRQDPDRAEHLLSDAITHAQEAIADIRRLVYALRPPALDDLGLLAALGEQINQYRASSIVLTLEAPGILPPLPAAIEMACYRIVQEALTNVVRHAHATAATVQLCVQDSLVVEVRDNGQGLPPGVRGGVGLRSMRERAEELGGTCQVEVLAKGGTRVYARLPLSDGRYEEHETAQQGEEVQ